MSGGEPLLFNNFVDFCRLIIEQGNEISIYTNLSKRKIIEDFIKTINPNYVRKIYAAVHIIEREKKGLSLKDFAENYLKLINNGFTLTCIYVIHPETISRLHSDIKKLRELGINNIQAKVFKGVFQGKKYPNSYSDEEIQTITSLDNNTYAALNSYLNKGVNSFKDKLCSAGFRSFKVKENGNVFRCATINKSYGNIYLGTFKPDQKPEPCTAKEVLAISWCKEMIIDNERIH
jgi:MoaA/NifB/PqqE/SkfB family radical SAM enzyme